MEVTRETLMAYLDGELDEITARRVDQAICEDSELAGRVEAERKLRERLRAHFAPVADEPIPEAWTAMIAAAAEEDEKLVSLADARRARAARAMPRWGAAAVIAASLALGVAIGTQISSGGMVVEKNGVFLASAGLNAALDDQLASDREGREMRMLASFRREGGDYCRAFSGPALSGIACREDDRWRLERLLPGSRGGDTLYRQAGSAEAELMAAAQEMAAGEPLDAEQEKAARDRDWR